MPQNTNATCRPRRRQVSRVGVVLQFRVVKSAGGTRQRSPQRKLWEGIENANEAPEGRYKGLSIRNLGH
jgi:hypothetical protein